MDALSALGVDVLLLVPVFLLLGLPIAMLYVQAWLPNEAFRRPRLRWALTGLYAIPASFAGAFFTAWLIIIAFDVVEALVSLVIGFLPFTMAQDSQAVFVLLLATGAITGGVYFWIGRMTVGFRHPPT